MRDELSAPLGSFLGRIVHIDNGIYLTETSGGPRFAVHESVATAELSYAARESGERVKRYLYYGFPERALPIYELSRTHPIVYGLADWEQVLKNLREHFPDYWAAQSLDKDEPEYGNDG
ncbi:MAG: hypothetical protein LBK23_06840 [Oscillospiraceae bacterium]|nr:hypothetical protein [Oscillospiraceae bacterium]